MSAADAKAAAFIQPVLLRDYESAACLGMGVRRFHELRNEPWMPRAVVLGPRMLRWPRAELEQAVALMPRLATATGTEPAHLRRKKIDAIKRGEVSA